MIRKNPLRSQRFGFFNESIAINFPALKDKVPVLLFWGEKLCNGQFLCYFILTSALFSKTLGK
jgi:hypothetical protein